MAHKKGFTLIELLVVIAIIAMLLAMLMPALRKAKQAGQKIVCRNNLKSIGMAALLYAGDQDQTLPRNKGAWIHLFMPYLGGAGDEKKDFTKIGVYNCPSYPDKNQTVDYVVSSWLDGEDEAQDDESVPGGKKTKITAWVNPGSKVYLADNEYGEGEINWRKIIEEMDDLDDVGSYDVWRWQHLPTGPDGTSPNDSRARRVARARHNKGNYIKESDFEVTDNNGNTILDNPNKNIGCNYLFLDGHSDWISANDSTEKIWQPGRF